MSFCDCTPCFPYFEACCRWYKAISRYLNELTGVPNIFRLEIYKNRVKNIRTLLDALDSFRTSADNETIYLLICKYEILLSNVDPRLVEKNKLEAVRAKYFDIKMKRRATQKGTKDNTPNTSMNPINNAVEAAPSVSPTSVPADSSAGTRDVNTDDNVDHHFNIQDAPGAIRLPILESTSFKRVVSLRFRRSVQREAPAENVALSHAVSTADVEEGTHEASAAEADAHALETLPDSLEEFILEEFDRLSKELGKEEKKAQALESFIAGMRLFFSLLASLLGSLIVYELNKAA